MRGIFKSVRVRVFQQLAHRVTHRIQRFSLLTRSRYAFSTLPTLLERRKERKKDRKKERKKERKNEKERKKEIIKKTELKETESKASDSERHPFPFIVPRTVVKRAGAAVKEPTI